MNTKKYIITGINPNSVVSNKYMITYGPNKEVETRRPCTFKEALEIMKKYVEQYLMHINEIKNEYNVLKEENPTPDRNSSEYDELESLRYDIEHAEFFELPVLMNSVEEGDSFVFIKNEGIVEYNLKYGWICNPKLIPISLEEFKRSISEVSTANSNRMADIWCDPISIDIIK